VKHFFDWVESHHLEESFESSYPVKLARGSTEVGLTIYDARTNSGLLEIEIFQQGRTHVVDFSIDGSFEVMTRAGEPFKILATVMKAMEMFIDLHARERGKPPKSFMITSNKDSYTDPDSGSKRHNVYIRIVKRFARNFGYSMVSVQDDRTTGQMKIVLKKD